MRKTFQKWLFFFVFIAFAITSGVSYVFRTHHADSHAADLIRINLNYMKNRIALSERNLESLKADLKTVLLEKAKSLAFSFSLNPRKFLNDKEFLKKWGREAGLSELNIIDDNGKIVASSSDAFVGVDFRGFDETRPYLNLIGKTDAGLVEDIRQSIATENGEVAYVQFAGVSRLDGKGFVQAGHSAARYAEALKTESLDHLADNFKIGETGSVLIVRDNRVISALSGDMRGKSLQDLGFPEEKSLKSGDVFRVTTRNGVLFCILERFDGYSLIGVYPETEMYASRNAILFWSFLFYLILFGVVFASVSALLEKVVISGIRRTNNALDKITAGNLNEKVDVRTNEEFISLSDGINSTVNALKKSIAEAAARIDKELEFARAIQKSSLPCVFPPYPDKTEFDLYASMDPAKEVGGDFYDFFALNEDASRLGVVIADVSGKGIPAALFMMSAKTLIKNFAEAGMEPADIFTQTNKELCENNETGMFVTAFMGILDIKSGRFVYVNAGHNPPLLKKGDGRFEYMKLKSGFMLGGLDMMRYTQAETVFEGGDTLFLYTDGVTEAQNVASVLYGDERLSDFVNSVEFDNPEKLLAAVRKDVDGFAGTAEQSDDLTMLGLRYNVYKMTVPAVSGSYDSLSAFISERLDKAECPAKIRAQTGVAFDEVFSNIVRYAYPETSGDMTLSCSIGGFPQSMTLVFEDSGVPFNPLARPDPDTSLPPEDREAGNLGIYLVKKIMDDVSYEYKNGRNVLTLRKMLHPEGLI